MAFSYFNDENLCENCFIVLNGKTSDIFVDRSLMLTDVRFALSRYLRSQGFEGVIFVDSIHRLYALDTPSARIMRGMASEGGSEASSQRTGGIDPADGPFGHCVRRRNTKAPSEKSQPGEDVSLSFGEMSIALSFEQVMNLLYNSRKKSPLCLPMCRAFSTNLRPESQPSFPKWRRGARTNPVPSSSSITQKPMTRTSVPTPSPARN